MKTILVADIMTRNLITIPPETNLLKCARIMVKKKIGNLLLVEGKKLLGIISRNDILWALTKKSRKELSKINAIDISPRKIATIQPTKTLNDAIEKIKKVRFARLPVMNYGELVGIITIKDIFNFNPDLFPEMKEYHRIMQWDEKVKRVERSKYRRFVEGVCEECGNVDLLDYFNGMLVCDSCRNS